MVKRKNAPIERLSFKRVDAIVDASGDYAQQVHGAPPETEEAVDGGAQRRYECVWMERQAWRGLLEDPLQR